MDGDKRLYGAIETQKSPWITTIWKDIDTKTEIQMTVSPFMNFCDDTPQSKQTLQSLFDPKTQETLSLDQHTLEELILRALLLLPGEGQNIFSGYSLGQTPPINCLNFLLSSNSSNKITSPPSLSPLAVIQFNHTHMSLKSFRRVTSLCHLIDRYFHWTIAKECYSYLLLVPLPLSVDESSDSFGTYLQHFREKYLLPLVTLTSPVSDTLAHDPPLVLLNLSSLSMNHSPLTLLECLTQSPTLTEEGIEVRPLSILLETGLSSSDRVAEASCLQKVTIARVALNMMRFASLPPLQ
jgi:hypothetical protein